MGKLATFSEWIDDQLQEEFLFDENAPMGAAQANQEIMGQKALPTKAKRAAVAIDQAFEALAMAKDRSGIAGFLRMLSTRTAKVAQKIEQKAAGAPDPNATNAQTQLAGQLKQISQELQGHIMGIMQMAQGQEQEQPAAPAQQPVNNSAAVGNAANTVA